MRRVLIADDDAEIREAFAFNLPAWGHDVVVASSGIEAWTTLHGQSAPKVAFFDSNVSAIDHLERGPAPRPRRAARSRSLEMSLSPERTGCPS